MKSLVLTSAEFPDFTDKQMQLICDIYNMPVTTHMFCLHLEASVQKMAFEPRGAKEKLQLLVLLLNIGDEGGIENPNKELSLTLRKLIFFGIFGGQLFAKDVKKIGDLCSMLSDLIGDSSLEGSKYGPEAVLFAMEPFIQGKVDRIPGCLVHKVAQLIEKYKVEGICFSRYFLFFVAACSKYDWSSDTGIFEQMLKWIRDWIRTRDVVREYAALYSSLKAVLFDSGHVLNPPLTIMAFKIILLLMDRDNKIRESMRQKKRYVMDYARYILSNIKLDGVESHEYVFRDQLSGNKPCEGPIERTLSKDFVEASEEERSAKITELRQPKLPSKCSESEELKSLIETLKPWQTEESATVIVKHLLDNSSTNDRAAFVYFLCAWNHVDGDVSTWISAVETTNVFYELVTNAFRIFDDIELKEYVVDLILLLLSKRTNQEPQFLSGFLYFVYEQCMAMDLSPLISSTVVKAVRVSEQLFVRACKLADWSCKMRDVLLALSVEKESETKLEVLKMLDRLNSFPLFFSYFFESADVCPAVLNYFYDPSTWRFALSHVSFAFQRLRASSHALRTIVQFVFKINFTEQSFLEFLAVIKTSFHVNRYEINMLFNTTNFLYNLMCIAEPMNSKDVMADLLYVCSSLNMYFDLFSRLEELLGKYFSDEDIISQLFKIVFGDDLGMSTPRSFVDPHPLTLLSRSMQKSDDRFKKFVEFVLDCIKQDSRGAYEIATLEFPSQLLQYLCRFRKSPDIDPMFKTVLNLFEAVFLRAVQPRDIILLFRLLTSLPGHERPCFTTEILRLMTKMYENTETISDYFQLEKPEEYVNLPAIPMNIINGDFAVVCHIRFLQPIQEIKGTILQLASETERFAVRVENGKVFVEASGNGSDMRMDTNVQLIANSWMRICFAFSKKQVEFVVKKKHAVAPFELPQFSSKFTDFSISQGISCHLASVMVLRNPSSSELDLLSTMDSKVTSFHESEQYLFGTHYASLFKEEFRSKVVMIFNAKVVHNKVIPDLVCPDAGEVVGTTFHSTTKPIDCLTTIGSATVFVPFLGQLNQPTLTHDGASKFVFDPTLLPLILEVVNVALKGSEVQMKLFNKANGFGMIGFLLSLSGESYMNDATIDAICGLFNSLGHPACVSLMTDVMWNMNIWLPTPFDFQLKAYKAFWNAIEARLKIDRGLLAHFNIRTVLTMMIVYLWDRMFNRRICLTPVQGQKATGEGSVYTRPEKMQPLRSLFWDIARALSKFPIDEEDVRFILSCCCVTGDVTLNREMLSFLIHLLVTKNESVLEYMRTHRTFEGFHVLLAFPDVGIASKVVRIFLLMAREEETMLRPYSVPQWVATIMTTMVPGKANLTFVQDLYRYVIGSPRRDEIAKMQTPPLKCPQVMPLLLQSILDLDETMLRASFVSLGKVIEKHMDKILDVPFCDHSFLLFLMQQLPYRQTSLSPTSSLCLALLSHIYRWLLIHDQTEKVCLVLPQVTTMISSILRIDYTHIAGRIFGQILQNELKRNNGADGEKIPPATLVQLCMAIFRYIFALPWKESWFSGFRDVDSPKETPTFQGLFKALIKSERPSVSFGFSTRTREDGTWLDAGLAFSLAQAILKWTRDISTCDPKDASMVFKALACIISTGINHPKHLGEFAPLIDKSLNKLIKTQHQKTAVLWILGGVARAAMTFDCKDFLKSRSELSPKVTNYVKQHAKLSLDSQLYSQLATKVTEPWACELVEILVKAEDSLAKSEVKVVDDEYKQCAQTLSKRNAKFVSQLDRTRKRRESTIREMSAMDTIHASLEQSATVSRHKLSQAAKSYRHEFSILSTDFGPWQPPEYVPDNHRKLSKIVVGNCRFMMKKNMAFSIHKEASLARDAVGPDIDPELFSKLLAERKMTAFLGDPALVAAATAEKPVKYISDHVVFSCSARYITLETVHSGKLSLTETSIYFDTGKKFFSISLSMIKSIFHRLCLLVDSAVEIFTIAKRSFFIDFNNDERAVFLETLRRSVKLPRLKFMQIVRKDINRLVEKAMTRWQNGQMSNFTLLMKLNKYAGRSYNDLSQYPVFPWVIADYTSKELDLKDSQTYRDLSKPLGAISAERLADLRKRYEFAKEIDENEAYLYGAFYSSAAVVIWFLIRMEPFTTLHVKLQGGKFDLASRLFLSIPAAWESCTSSIMDFRELIPEFFYLPDFLVNENQNDLGIIRSTGARVWDVELPPWADSPRDFIVKHRAALESMHVSAMLPEWLDLIFGPKSRGKLADEADNLFHPFFYEETLLTADPSKTQLIKEYGACFGAAPRQLFTSKPGPRKHTLPLHHSLRELTAVHHGNLLGWNTSPIIAMHYSAKKNSVYVVNSALECAELSLPDVTRKNKTRFNVPIPDNLTDVAEIGVTVALGDEYAIIALPWDPSFYVYEISNPNTPKYVYRDHSEHISALAVSGDVFITCSRDRSFCIWQAEGDSLVALTSVLKHNTPVKIAGINNRLKMCVAIGQRGFLVAVSTLDGTYIGGKRLGLADPGHVAISDFGSIAVCSTQRNKSTIKVVDQNLVDVCEKEIPIVVKCWKCISWTDGADYLVICREDRSLALYKLPFLEEVEVDLAIGENPVTIEVVQAKDPVLLIADDKGGLWSMQSFLKE